MQTLYVGACVSSANPFSSLWAKAFSDSSHYLLVSLIVRGLSLVVIPLLTRLFSLEQFAIYDLFLAGHGILFVLCGLGLDSGTAILLTESSADRQKLSLLLVLSIISTSFSVLLVWLIGVPVFVILDFDAIQLDVWSLLCAYSCFSLISHISVNFSRWVGRVKTAAYLSLVSSVSGMVAGIALLMVLGQKIDYYLYGLTFGAFGGSLISLFIFRDYISGVSIDKLPPRFLKEVFKLSLPFVPVYLGNSLMQMTDRFLILVLLDLKALGIYALVSRIASIPGIFVNVLRAGFLPVLFKNHQSDEGQRFIRQVLYCYATLIPIGVIVSYFLSDYATRFFGGESYDTASPFLVVMVTSVLISSSTAFNGFGYTIMRKTPQVMYITYGSLVLNLLLSAFLALYIGLAGIVVGTLVAAAVQSFLYTYFSERLYRFGYNLGYIYLFVVSSCIGSVYAMSQAQ